MHSKISEILKEIKSRKNDLLKEYENLKEKYGFAFIKGKIMFNLDRKKENRKLRKSIWDSLFGLRIREVISMPFIYSMIIPALILDIFLFIYQQTAIRLY